MKNYRSITMKEAYKNAGFRERFAMENGNKTKIIINNHVCYKFIYSKHIDYQDANGAIYDTIEKRWRS